MTNRAYGILAGIIGSAIATWWVVQRQRSAADERDRGTVIFDNTPTATRLTETPR